MSKKVLVFILVAIIAAGCRGNQVPQAETQTLFPTATTTVEAPTAQAAQTHESVYDTYWVERYEGAIVTIEKVELRDNHFKVILKTLHGAKFSYYEWDDFSMYESRIGTDGLTHGNGKHYSIYNEEGRKKLLEYVESTKSKVWIYKIGSQSENGLVSTMFYEYYIPTKKDVELEKLLAHVFSQHQYLYPSNGIEDLLRNYSQWGTKENLNEFLELISHPSATHEYYKTMAESEELMSLPTTNLDVTLLGQIERFGEFQVIIYKKDMLPDTFKKHVQNFPNKVILENYEFEFVPFISSYEYPSGYIFRFSNRELIIPEGETLVIIKSQSRRCECWSPLVITQILGVYR